MSTEWQSTEAPATQPVVDWFHPTLTSRWLRVRVVVAVLMLGLVVLLALITPAWNARTLALMAVVLGFAAALDYVVRRQIRVDRSPVILTPQGIESENFDGSQKTYAWRDMAGIRIVPVGNGNALHLDLVPSASSTAGSWLSRRRQPFIPLATYSADDQDRIVEAVRHHLRQTHSGATVIAELTQERELIAPLIAAAPNPRVTYALMLVSMLLWLLMVVQWGGVWHASDEALLRWGALATSEVQRYEWWRVVSAAFVHTGLLPLAITMMGLWSVGCTAERIYGHRPYLLIFIGSAMVASALSLHFSAQNVVFAGGAASGVFGLAGALLVVLYHHREMRLKLLSQSELAGLGLFVLYALIQGFRPSGLDNGAHLGALLVGAALAATMPERFDMDQYAAAIMRRCAAGLAAAIVLSGIVILLAAPAHTDVSRQWNGPAEYDQGIKSFAAASQLMQLLRDQVKAGTMTDQQFDAKTRSTLAPAFGQARDHFLHAWLPESDPRRALLTEFTRLTGLMTELLAMKSVIREDRPALQPTNPQRAMVLNAEIRASAEHKDEIEASLRAPAPVAQ